MRRLNDWIGDKTTDALSTMEMTYVVAIIVIIPLFFQHPTTLIGWIKYGTQTFYQGVALSLLAFNGKKGEKRINRKLDDIHEWMKESHDQLHRKIDGKKGKL